MESLVRYSPESRPTPPAVRLPALTHSTPGNSAAPLNATTSAHRISIAFLCDLAESAPPAQPAPPAKRKSLMRWEGDAPAEFLGCISKERWLVGEPHCRWRQYTGPSTGAASKAKRPKVAKGQTRTKSA